MHAYGAVVRVFRVAGFNKGGGDLTGEAAHWGRGAGVCVCVWGCSGACRP